MDLLLGKNVDEGFTCAYSGCWDGAWMDFRVDGNWLAVGSVFYQTAKAIPGL
jgi:hypothetical protein